MGEMLIAEITTMKHVTFTAEIARAARVTTDLETTHDRALWRDAAAVLRERVYTTETGAVTVRADWTAMQPEATIVQLEIDVEDRRAQIGARDFPTFVERYLHDVFLLLNVAVPGAFGGVISTTGGEFRVEELTFDASLFEYAWVHALRGRRLRIAALPLSDVTRWYDALGVGMRDTAENATETVLFHLLHIARANDECATRVRLAQCLDALQIDDHAVRTALDLRSAPVLHPLHDVDEIEVADAIDRAAALVIAAVQERVGA
ncbi:MAG TPA: hypothetical protein VE010_17860 [Thermoanaerobaculia bacterium]|nr:hypothetical protein [Thermoanaerobaculia bacterium]